MITVPVYEAKTRLSEILLLAQQGQDITITRHGVAAARLVAPLPVPGDGADPRTAQRQSVNAALDALSVLIFPGRHSAPPTARAVRLMSREQVEAVAARSRRLIDGLDLPRWPDTADVCHGAGSERPASPLASVWRDRSRGNKMSKILDEF